MCGGRGLEGGCGVGVGACFENATPPRQWISRRLIDWDWGVGAWIRKFASAACGRGGAGVWLATKLQHSCWRCVVLCYIRSTAPCGPKLNCSRCVRMKRGRLALRHARLAPTRHTAALLITRITRLPHHHRRPCGRSARGCRHHPTSTAATQRQPLPCRPPPPPMPQPTPCRCVPRWCEGPS